MAPSNENRRRRHLRRRPEKNDVTRSQSKRKETSLERKSSDATGRKKPGRKPCADRKRSRRNNLQKKTNRRVSERVIKKQTNKTVLKTVDAADDVTISDGDSCRPTEKNELTSATCGRGESNVRSTSGRVTRRQERESDSAAKVEEKEISELAEWLSEESGQMDKSLPETTASTSETQTETKTDDSHWAAEALDEWLHEHSDGTASVSNCPDGGPVPAAGTATTRASTMEDDSRSTCSSQQTEGAVVQSSNANSHGQPDAATGEDACNYRGTSATFPSCPCQHGRQAQQQQGQLLPPCWCCQRCGCPAFWANFHNPQLMQMQSQRAFPRQA